MPLKKVKGGWKCPKTGRVYKTKAAGQKARQRKSKK